MFFLPVSPDKVVRLAGIDVEHALPCCPYPLGGHCDETEEEALDPVRGFHPEETHEGQRDDIQVEVGGHGGEQQEHGVLVHERLGQVCPSEIVVLPVEHLLCRATFVVVEDDLLVRHVPVVGQDAAVGVLPVKEVELLALALALPLPLHHEAAVADVIELLEREGLHLVFLVANLHGGPSRRPLHLLIECLVTLCPDVELLRVLHDHLHDILAVGSAVGTEAPGLQAETFHQLEEATQGLGLHEADVGVAVPVLQVDDVPTYRHHAGAVAQEVLVCAFGVVLLCLDELVAEIHVVFAAAHQLAGGEQQLDEQAVQFLGGVEIVDLARLGGRVGHVVSRKFLNGAQNGV